MTDWQRKPRDAPDGLVLAATIAAAVAVATAIVGLANGEWLAATSAFLAAVAFAWVALERRER